MNEVGNNGTDQSTENGTGEDAAVKDVVEMINALPAAETITEETDLVSLKDQVNTAHAAYDALSAEQKATFNADVLGKLTALEAKISELESNDQETKPSDAVQTVVDDINALPAVETITEETDLEVLKTQVNAARAAYDALSAEQKESFDATVLEKLTALEAKISELESNDQETESSEAVQNVIEKIDAAVEQIDYTTETITATDGTTVTKTHITMLKDLDPANNAELKALIDKEAAHEQDENQPALTNEEAAQLDAARKAFEDASAKYRSEGFSNAQLAARQAYDALATEEEKAQVTNYSLLTDMEANIAYIMQAVNTLPEGEDVAMIGDTKYKTLDEAIAAAGDGAIIEILRDCNLTQFPNKTLTFTGNGTITLRSLKRSDLSAGKTVTFTGEGINFIWDTTGLTSEKNMDQWLLLALSGKLNVQNKATVEFKMDSKNGEDKWITYDNNGKPVTHYCYPVCAIYVTSTTEINVDNATFKITGINSSNIAGQGIQSESPNAKINVTNSTFTIEGTNRGYVSSPTIYVENSTFTVQNCTSNASNGGNFTAINSTVTYQNNKGHGLSAGNVILKNSTLTSDNNGLYGVFIRDSLDVDGSSTLNVTRNSYDADDSGLQIYNGATASIATGAIVNIKDNYCSGLSNWGTCTFDEGSILTITGNINNKSNTSLGGGIYSTNHYDKNTGKQYYSHLTLPSDAIIYNNHAKAGGDDIYNTGEITFSRIGDVEPEWILDDTNLPITGWYFDGNNNGKPTKRWKQDTQEDSYQLFNDFDDTGRVTLTGIYALKAAHAYSYNPETPVNPTTWEHSKSKIATNLDANYQSQVTLSLPAADYPSKLEIVFVVDGTAWKDFSSYKSGIQDILDQLKSFENITADVALVSFGNTAKIDRPLTSVQDFKLPILPPMSSGTNIQSGIRAAREILENGDPYAQKYMVLLTDGGAFYWLDDNGNSVTKPYKSGENGSFFDSTAQEDSHIFNNNLSGLYSLASGNLVNFREKYKAEIESFNQTATVCEKGTQENQLEGQYIYKTDDWSDKEKYPFTNMEQGIYNASQEMLEAANSGINLITIGSYDYYPDQPAVHAMSNQFLDWTSTVGKLYKFNTGNENDSLENALSDVKDELIYLLDEGSSIVDVIGEGIDNAGNEYDFKFINDINNLNLTVGGVPLNKTTIVENTSYGFGEKLDNGKYEFELTYYPDGIGKEARSQEVIAGELFRFDINVPITIDKPVQLTYTVQLTNPQTADGTYGQYDADGSEEYAGLYTNKMAILYPVDSNGVEGEQEAFQKPTVSYSISNGKPVDPPVDPEDPTPRPGGGGDEDDDTPTIINDTPVPTTTIDDEDVPLTDLPEDTVTIDDEEVPLKDIPNTGDMIPVPAMVASVISIGGIALLMKKHK